MTYATVRVMVSTEPIWHNVAKRRQQTLARRLKELAAELEREMANFSILDDEQRDSVL